MYLSRTIIDHEGVRWLVSETGPVPATPTLEDLRVRHEQRRAWLAFESERGAVRELLPVPDDWPRCSDAALVAWLDRATPLDPSHARRWSDPRLAPPATEGDGPP